ncbi:MAG: septum formation initiator family protein [Candidatus Kerfeldbacteria bacterium]|nr:septum formation initiator family protein [Candidatus Kerfeldbacteria bacterium]
MGMPRPSRPSFWERLSRSRLTLVLGAFLILVALVSFAREFLRRMEVQSDIARLQTQVREFEERKTTVSGLIDYFESPLFQEQEAREKLGLAKPGESVVIVPLSNETVAVAGAPSPDGTTPSRNPAKWWNYFFHRSESTTTATP